MDTFHVRLRVQNKAWQVAISATMQPKDQMSVGIAYLTNTFAAVDPCNLPSRAEKGIWAAKKGFKRK